ncbi:hypothetical protein BKA12_002470 [Neomicrococcus lactis]|uniref:Uncharacterized protein n=1 Tax=Neomicrococcus lactis TaxID=732241 RepID=A0A7W9DCL8_9MICC|nr:hypothetical protein [Neomicrococcus lactis]
MSAPLEQSADGAVRGHTGINVHEQMQSTAPT